MPTRPLSPHLSVYQMSRYTLATSIFNRLTGLALSAGLLLLVYWLLAVAAGARAHARAAQLLSLPLMKLVYLALIVAFSYHLVAGVRHLVWDSGRALEREQSRRSAWLVLVLSLLLSVGIACGAWLAGSHAP
ncbi:MAG TPA: succinate dehydrogenase, cytochrome b556 subunit [Steroidobacteraceae bacterium]|nr:succinate dehydrogenase, cytochrome b556 subunit [Steroidobacteraceae bacterium]